MAGWLVTEVAEVRHPDPTTGQPSSSDKDVYTYIALGQVTTFADRIGNVHTYGYDVLGRTLSDAVTTLGETALVGVSFRFRGFRFRDA